MVITPIACAFNVTSGLIVNGICSYYDSLEEEKRMKYQEQTLRESIRLELQRNRDVECKHKRKRDDEGDIFESCLRAERRRKLIATRIIRNPIRSNETASEILRSNSLVDSVLEEDDDETDDEEEGHDEDLASLVTVKLDQIDEEEISLANVKIDETDAKRFDP